MKSIVLAVLLVSAASGFGQANFAGEYLGVLSSSNTNAPERYCLVRWIEYFYVDTESGKSI